MIDTTFWDRIARKYAKSTIANIPAYEQTLDHVRRHLRATDTVLEVGCGTGSTALLLAASVARYKGTDFSSEMIAIAREKLADTPLDGLTFDVSAATLDTTADQSQDVVLALNLYHLVPDIAAALNAAHRSLRPGGLLISKSPCLAGKWYLRPIIKIMQLVGKAPYLRYLSIKDYDAAIKAAGFDIVETALYSPKTPNRFVVARKR